MKSIRFWFPVTAVTLACVLALGGCKRSNNQAANSENPAQSAANNPPAPPPDQTQPAQTPAGQSQPTQTQQPAPAPQPTTLEIPRDTRIRVRLDQDLGSKISQPGESFGATVADDVVVNGQVAIPRGSHAVGTVIDAKALGHFKGGALLELRLERIRVNGGSYAVATSTMERVEKGKGMRTAKFAGGGGAFGALIGGLAGGGKGALVGALAGAGAGTAGSAMTGNKEIFLPAETLITFRLEHGVQITQ